MSDLLCKIGIACIILAIVGGGASVLGLKVPVIKTVSRQVLLAIFGAILIAICLLMKAPKPSPKRVAKSADTNSGSINVGCKDTLPGHAPQISFGPHPSDIVANAKWIDTDNIKSQTQTAVDIMDAAGTVVGVKADGSITGLDTGFTGCPGGRPRNADPSCHLDRRRALERSGRGQRA